MKPGDKVICIEENPGGNCPIRKGDVLTIQGVLTCQCGAPLLDFGIYLPKDSTGTTCRVCGRMATRDKWVQHGFRFRLRDNSYCQHVLFEIVPETLDV